ncbi:LysM peptidoglycan-binding domain-containing protein [Nocardioides sp. JQ2195]|uniref:LysM peptidoglycan-binding domain-containing protein n=1 Tax=Nocardioides sp. JQ2195 TaxID=2592334 RepID=UPI00143E34A5|nr:LysM peptidoglycan-binding domain-containing protein [Nocardioides sp. JQ2195]QIX27661.1 LysM peptidoglycan-binding domain-containing protein [Nocardioides sp. JQ2195]
MPSRERSTAAPARCLLVWLVASAGLAALLQLLLPHLRRTIRWVENPALAPATLEEALADVAAVLLAGCLVWWWVATSFAVVEAATCFRLGPCPRLIRRTVLVACGIGLASGLSPASADQSAGQPPQPSDDAVIVGLQLPDRQSLDAHAPGPRTAPARVPVTSTVIVRAGDSLWRIAEAELPPRAGARSIDALWREIWAANRALIGTDPDLIRPGAQLHLPPRHHNTQEK